LRIPCFFNDLSDFDVERPGAGVKGVDAKKEPAAMPRLFQLGADRSGDAGVKQRAPKMMRYG